MTDDDFSLDRILELLQLLDDRLRDQGVAATIYVVGGAAVALRGVDAGRRTADIDVLPIPERQVMQAAADVASEQGISSDWLSSAVRPWVPSPDQALDRPSAPGLRVVTASDRHLLAMKIVAARGERDMRDVMGLAERVGISSAGELYALVIDVYGPEAIESVHGGTADLMLHCSAVARVLGG